MGATKGGPCMQLCAGQPLGNQPPPPPPRVQRTACPTNTSVRTVFFEDLIVRWIWGGGRAWQSPDASHGLRSGQSSLHSLPLAIDPFASVVPFSAFSLLCLLPTGRPTGVDGSPPALSPRAQGHHNGKSKKSRNMRTQCLNWSHILRPWKPKGGLLRTLLGLLIPSVGGVWWGGSEGSANPQHVSDPPVESSWNWTAANPDSDNLARAPHSEKGPLTHSGVKHGGGQGLSLYAAVCTFSGFYCLCMLPAGGAVEAIGNSPGPTPCGIIMELVLKIHQAAVLAQRFCFSIRGGLTPSRWCKVKIRPGDLPMYGLGHESTSYRIMGCISGPGQYMVPLC